MNNIKSYEPIIIIYYKDIDGTIAAVPTQLTNRSKILKAINNQKIIDIEGIGISTNDIKQIREPDNDHMELLFTQPRNVRQKILKYYGNSLQNIANISIDKLRSEINKFTYLPKTNAETTNQS